MKSVIDPEMYNRIVYGMVYIAILFTLLTFGITFWKIFIPAMILCYELFLTPQPSKLCKTLMIGYIYLGFSAWIQLSTQNIALIPALIVIGTDTGAYCAGKFLNHYMNFSKPFPEISSNKTYIGYIGGIISGCIVAIILKIFGYDTFFFYTIFIILGAFAGDLLGSAIKRDRGIKDSSDLIPGHGGLWDRLDSLLLAGICAAIYNGIL